MTPLLVLVIAGAPHAEPARIVTAPAPRACETQMRPVVGTPRAAIHTLAQEPNADALLPVLRMQNGCPTPVKIREDIGAQPPHRR